MNFTRASKNETQLPFTQMNAELFFVNRTYTDLYITLIITEIYSAFLGLRELRELKARARLEDTQKIDIMISGRDAQQYRRVSSRNVSTSLTTSEDSFAV